jgi:hypothetical protein
VVCGCLAAARDVAALTACARRGNTNNGYASDTADFDAFSADNKDWVALIAAGNDGGEHLALAHARCADAPLPGKNTPTRRNTVGSPATAKVAACARGPLARRA